MLLELPDYFLSQLEELKNSQKTASTEENNDAEAPKDEP